MEKTTKWHLFAKSVQNMRNMCKEIWPNMKSFTLTGVGDTICILFVQSGFKVEIQMVKHLYSRNFKMKYIDNEKLFLIP